MKRLTFASCLLLPLPALAAQASSHHDPIASLVLALAIILIAAKLGGDLALRIGQPAVLGELVAGVILGNLGLLGLPALAFIRESPLIDSLARLGVLVLLFEIGLESTVKQMLSVGLSAFLVATLGVIAPFVLGVGVGMWLLPEQGGPCMPSSAPRFARRASGSPRACSRISGARRVKKRASSWERRSSTMCWDWSCSPW